MMSKKRVAWVRKTIIDALSLDIFMLNYSFALAFCFIGSSKNNSQRIEMRVLIVLNLRFGFLNGV